MALDQNTLSELKEKLLQEKARLESELRRIAKPTTEPGNFDTKFENIGNDPDDNATEVEGYVDNLALEDNLEKQLKDVTDALERMAKGAYGVDEKTGQAINIDRLKAYPAARTAI